MPAGFWDRIRNLYRNTIYPQHNRKGPVYVPRLPSSQPVVPQPKGPTVGPTDMSDKIGIISEAGKRRVMLKIKYDGQVRLVEPYSMRDRPTGRQFYGWCSIHNRIHSFKPEKIESIELTDIVYAPRWDVEF